MRPLPALNSLTLTLTERCNLRCSYCYVPTGRTHTMTASTCDAAIELLRACADPSRDPVLSFFGGEPFLEVELMERAIRGARTRLGPNVKVLTPTNGLCLSESARALARASSMEIALSIDTARGPCERRYADGSPSTPELFDSIPELMRLGPEVKWLARMTVTPKNVGQLSESVKGLARAGFKRIVFLPAYEQVWTDADIAVWQGEHRRIGTWLVGAHGAGTAVPDLPGWRGVESRLLLGRKYRGCGAGSRIAAIDTHGRIFPCYRFVFLDDATWSLGNVREGYTNHELLQRFSDLRPEGARPESGSCASCSARDGCTAFCPAMGAIELGDPQAVPSVVCRLMRAQVEAIRPYAAVKRARRKPAPRTWAAAAVAAAMTSAVLAASCGGSAETSSGGVSSTDAGSDADGATGETGVDAQGFEVGAGQCPVLVDASGEPDVIGPGICDYQDAGGGVCPMQVDAAEEVGPGLCPAGYDGGGGLC